MRKTKTIRIDGHEITVKELRVKDLQKITEAGDNFFLADHIGLLCDVDLSALYEMAPSEIRIIYEAVMEVNADFLELMEKTGMIKTIKNLMQEQFADIAPGLSNTAM